MFGSVNVKKEIKIVFILILALAIIMFVGNQHYNKKLASMKEQSIQYFNQKQEAKEKAEAEQKAREKAIYEEHLGEKLVYAPMGDSISEGWDATSEEKRFITVLSKMIKEKMGYDVQVTDVASRAGTGLKDNGLPNLDLVLEQKPDFITIEYGTNDLYELRKAAYSPPEEFKENLSTLIDSIRTKSSKQPKLLLVTTWYRNEKTHIYDEIIKQVGEAKDIQVVDISSVWKRGDTAGPIGNYTPFRDGDSDDWHPNDLGHQLIAEEVYKVAYEILQ